MGFVMGFFEAVRVCFRKSITLKGRASCSEYWYFQLFFLMSIIGMIILNIELGDFAEDYSFFFCVIISLGLFIVQTSAAVRRLHDSELSGWCLLTVLMPLGSFFCLFLLLREGTWGDNDYGPCPFDVTTGRLLRPWLQEGEGS